MITIGPTVQNRLLLFSNVLCKRVFRPWTKNRTTSGPKSEQLLQLLKIISDPDISLS